MERRFIMLGAFFAFLGVLMGAFSGHMLASQLAANNRTATFETAVQYQMYHALALIVIASISERWSRKLVQWAGWLFVIGILIFSGSLYILSIFDMRWIGAVTPVGGIAFLVGWLCLGLSAGR
jgi:uncharacterized membrane protein YgdD (TMEM256/DUF423 family)